MVVLLILIGAILCMSRYAEHRKAENQNNTHASSEQTSVTPNDASKSTENADKTEHRPDFIDTFTWPEGATVWALFLTLIVIAWQSAETRSAAKATEDSAEGVKSQSALMKRQADLMEKTLILQYRPKVVVRNCVAKDFNVEIGEPIKCTLAFQLVNTGGSPASIIEGEMYLLAVSAHDLNDIRFVEGAHGIVQERVLQPGQRENFEDILDFPIIVDAEWVEFSQGAKSVHSLYLWGTVWYRDDLSIPRRVGIHRKYNPQKKNFPPDKDNEEEYSD